MGHCHGKGAPHRHCGTYWRQQGAGDHAGCGAKNAEAGAGGNRNVGDLMTLLDHRHHHRLPGCNGRHRLHGLHAQLAKREGARPGRDGQVAVLLRGLCGLAGQHSGGGRGHAGRGNRIGEGLGGGIARAGGDAGVDGADALGIGDLFERRLVAL